MDPNDLLVQHRSGNPNAFAQLVECLEGPLVRYAHGLTGELELARDAVQDAFLALVRLNGSAPDSPTAWLYRVTRNRALDRIKKESRMRNRETAVARPESVPPPTPAVETNERQCAVTRHLTALPPEVREVLALKVIEGLSYRQIADVTGHNLSRIGTLIHQGLGQLARDLRAAGVV